MIGLRLLGQHCKTLSLYKAKQIKANKRPSFPLFSLPATRWPECGCYLDAEDKGQLQLGREQTKEKQELNDHSSLRLLTYAFHLEEKYFPKQPPFSSFFLLHAMEHDSN